MATLLSTDPIDVQLTETGDWLIDAQGSHFSSGLTGVAQAVDIRLKLFMTEWFLNLDAGVDWWSILGEKFNEQIVHNEVSREILGAPGMVSISSLLISFDDRSREMTITWSGVCQFGDIPSTTVVVPLG